MYDLSSSFLDADMNIFLNKGIVKKSETPSLKAERIRKNRRVKITMTKGNMII
jgi:hypothetical protein